jgi:hypothetical protein
MIDRSKAGILVGPDGVVRPPPDAVERFADSDRWKMVFSVRSDSKPSLTYKVGWDSASNRWACDCLAGVHHGHCKHTKRYGLYTRANDPKKVKPVRGAPKYVPAPPPVPQAPQPVAFAPAAPTARPLPATLARLPVRRFLSDEAEV